MFLRRVLIIDAVASAATGLLMLLGMFSMTSARCSPTKQS